MSCEDFFFLVVFVLGVGGWVKQLSNFRFFARERSKKPPFGENLKVGFRLTQIPNKVLTRPPKSSQTPKVLTRPSKSSQWWPCVMEKSSHLPRPYLTTSLWKLSMMPPNNTGVACGVSIKKNSALPLLVWGSLELRYRCKELLKKKLILCSYLFFSQLGVINLQIWKLVFD